MEKCFYFGFGKSYLEYVLWNEDKVHTTKPNLGKNQENIDEIPEIEKCHN